MLKHHDYLIIGAGPAGLQLAYFFEKSGYDYLIIEAGEKAGISFEKFPRHRKLISINKVYTGYEDTEINLRWDWNALLSDSDDLLFKNYTDQYFPPAQVLVDYLNDFADSFHLKIQYNTKVVKIEKPNLFNVIDSQGNVYTGKKLIVATGFSQPYIPQVPGIELTENYVDVSVNPQDFKNQKVLIVGKGNSGFETADNLIETTATIHVLSPSPLNLAWKTHYVGHLRAINNNFLDTYQLKSQNAILDATIKKIERKDDKYIVSVSYTHANGETEDLIYDRVIICAGFRFDAEIFAENCRPELAINGRFPAQTSEWESTNIPDLYFAGVLMQMRDYKKATSGFIHGFRYNVRVLYRILAQKYHQQPWPSSEIKLSLESLVDIIIKRVNKTSALWQQFGFLADVIVVEGNTAKYYEEITIDYVRDSELGKKDNYYILTLEFGKIKGDPFNIERNPVPHKARESVFLHPVLRHFSGSQLIDEIHLLEDLDAEWNKEYLHIKPLWEYLSKNLSVDPYLELLSA